MSTSSDPEDRSPGAVTEIISTWEDEVLEANAQKDFVGAVLDAVEPVLGTNGTTPARKR
jgi:hypothetical protein